MTAPVSKASQEIPGVKSDIAKLGISIQGIRAKQDFWGEWNLRFAVLAIILGTFSWVCQRRAAIIEKGSRPLQDDLKGKTEHQAELQSQDSAFQINLVQAETAATRLEAATANDKAQRAILEQAKLNNANLELQATVERERTARAQLLATLAYRTLNVGELGELRGATYAYRKVPLDILYVATGDDEVRQFAARLNAAFDIWKPNLFAINDAGQPGLSVEFNPDDPQASDAAQHFFEALKGHGFRVNGPFPSLPYTPKSLIAPGTPRANLRLIVGERDRVYLPPEMRK